MNDAAGIGQAAGDAVKIPPTPFSGLYIKATAAAPDSSSKPGHDLKVVIVEREGSLPSIRIEGSLQEQAAELEKIKK